MRYSFNTHKGLPTFCHLYYATLGLKNPLRSLALPAYDRGNHARNMLDLTLHWQNRNQEGPMRAVAIVANLIQMFIILILFFIQGLTLGGLTIFALFVLLLVAFVNLLVLLFHSALSETNRTDRRNEKQGLVKRQDLRVRYTPAARPELVVDKRCFSVLDLSENGIRIHIRRQEPLKRRFRGRLTLLSRQTLDIQVFQVRRQGNEAALLIKQPLDWDVLSTEKELVSIQK
jgi:hypothetical protein